MTKNLIASLAILLSFSLTSCEDEAGVVTSGGNNGGGNNGSSTSCVFDGVDENFSSCVTSTSNEELEVITWNIEQFPVNGATTLTIVEDIIYNTNADVIALQEIRNISEFNKVLENLEGWEGDILDISGSLNMGYIYKSCEININSSPTIFSGIEPRPAIVTTITHTNGLEVTLFNIHLKCCGDPDEIERRRQASENLKTLIDNSYSDQNVIVLGDFNDDIDSDSPFSNFINDEANYKFADAAIAAGNYTDWSYPSWPSHIDHILISNELFDNLVYTETLIYYGCAAGYSSNVSDHRPVMSVFKAEE